MKKTVAFTSAAFNYVPKVRTLCNSIRKYHPEFEIALALADKLPANMSWESEPLDRVLPVGELGIPDVDRWTFFHTIVELATAIKPFALLKLLEDPAVERVIYFDPDMMLFSRLDDLIDGVQGASIGLTPHQTKPETTRRRVMDNEISSLKHGVYNLGFLVVNNNSEGLRFARWWADRIYDFCVADIPNGLFTDQRWVDLAPAFFEDVKILKSPRFNVAPWNVSTRELAGDTENGFTVDGEPLGFYHFTGFDSGAHAIMAEVNAPGNESLRELIEFYRLETRLDSNDSISNTPWAFGTYDNGLKIDTPHRRVYRSRYDLREAFPSPFSTEGQSNYLNWATVQGPLECSELKKNEKFWRLRSGVRTLWLAVRDGVHARYLFSRSKGIARRRVERLISSFKRR